MTSTNESLAMEVDGTKQQSCPTKKMRLDVPLHQAVEEGMLEYLESQFKAGVDINKKKSNGWALIHTAVSSNQLEVVKLLIKYGADVNVLATDTFRAVDTLETPLHLATFNGNDEIAKLLMSHGAKVDVSVKGIMPLHMAVCNNDMETITMILERTDNVDPKDENGSTPLHRAIMTNNIDIAKLLISRGASIEAETKEALRPIHVAILSGSIAMIEILLNLGASINAKVSVGLTPLHMAVSCSSMLRNLDRFGTKIEKQWKIMTKGPKRHNFSLELLENDRFKIVQLLLKRNALIEEPTNSDQTPLVLAAKNGFYEIGRLLLLHGANVNVKDYKELTPLHHAVISNKLELVKELLKNGSLVDSSCSYGCQPLHKATSFEVAKVLIIHGAKVDAEDLGKNSPIHYAVKSNSVDVVKTLIKSGASIHNKDKEENTPFDIAIANGKHIEIIKVLIANGANVNTIRNGNAPIHVAVKNSDVALTELLIKNSADINMKMMPYFRNGEVLTPLHLAIAGGKEGAINVLKHVVGRILSSGSYIKDHFRDFYNFMDISHKMYRLKYGNDEKDIIAEMLINHGAETNVKNVHGLLPFHFAMLMEKTHIQSIMINTGKIDVNHKTNFPHNNETLLTFAFRFGLTKSIPILMNYGVSLTIRNDDLEDPKEYLIRNMDISKFKQVLTLEHNI